MVCSSYGCPHIFHSPMLPSAVNAVSQEVMSSHIRPTAPHSQSTVDIVNSQQLHSKQGHLYSVTTIFGHPLTFGKSLIFCLFPKETYHKGLNPNQNWKDWKRADLGMFENLWECLFAITFVCYHLCLLSLLFAISPLSGLPEHFPIAK